MKCPNCGAGRRDGKMKVTDSRFTPGAGTLRRRRWCKACGHRFTTLERIVRRDRHPDAAHDARRMVHKAMRLLDRANRLMRAGATDGGEPALAAENAQAVV
jgi:transcriptional regulator NrdR family protein